MDTNIVFRIGEKTLNWQRYKKYSQIMTGDMALNLIAIKKVHLSDVWDPS